MSDEVRRPLHRKNLTGRHHTAPGEVTTKERKQLMREQQKSIRDFPEEARLARELIKNIDFEAIRAMYEDINLRSAGPLKEPHHQPGEQSLHRAVPKVATNSITAKDVYLVAPREAEYALPGARYGTRLNTVLMNIRAPHIKYLLEAHNSPRPFTRDGAWRAVHDLYNFYHLFFHELGHAYGYVYQSLHRTSDGKGYFIGRSGMGEKRIAHEPIEGTNRVRVKEYTDLEFWVEGFNELQTFFRLREYLQHHSLCLSDICLPRDSSELWDHFVAHNQYSSYGAVTMAVDRVLEVVCDLSNVPYPKVYDAFARTFQTKGGKEELLRELGKILGPQLVDRIRKTRTTDVAAADILSHDILVHLKTDSDILGFVENFVTSPGRGRSSAQAS